MINVKNKDLNLVYAISFMDLFAVGLTFPLLSNHLRELGASHLSVGLINSLYSGLQVLSGPVIGSWSDVRDRKSVLIATLLLSSICYIALGVTSSILVIAILRLVLGITKHTQSICKAIITDFLPPEKRASAFGKSAAFGSLGFIIGPILGGHLSEIGDGFSYVCAITGVLFIINIGLTFAIRDIHGAPKKQVSLLLGLKSEFAKSVTEMADINWRTLWDIFLIRFIFGFAVTMYFSQQSTYLREQFGLSQRHVGYTISYFSAAGTATAFLLPSLTEYAYKSDETCSKRLFHFFILMTLSLIGLYLAPCIEIFLVILIPFSLSCTFLRIVSMELMLKYAENTHRGSLSGTSNSIMSVARFVTPMTSGLISDKIGGHSAMLFAALPPLIGAVLVFRMKPKSTTKIKSN